MTVSLEGFLGSFTTKAARKPEQVFARFNGEPITFAALDTMSAALAAELRQRGLKSGDRAAVDDAQFASVAGRALRPCQGRRRLGPGQRPASR